MSKFLIPPNPYENTLVNTTARTNLPSQARSQQKDSTDGRDGCLAGSGYRDNIRFPRTVRSGCSRGTFSFGCSRFLADPRLPEINQPFAAKIAKAVTKKQCSCSNKLG